MQIGMSPFLRHCTSRSSATSYRRFLLSVSFILRRMLLCRFTEQEFSKLQSDVEMSRAFGSIEENGVGQSSTPPLA